LFTQVLLVDEINRTTPRTQAALLEAMAERGATVDGVTYELEPPFLVIATQNPVDHEGTFPLPEAQLDRFLMRLSLGYPSHEEEGELLDRLQHAHPIDSLQPVTSADEVLACQLAVRSVHVDPKIRDYVLDIVHASREHDDVALGGSPRASISLFRAAQAMAAVRGRDFVLPDDVKRMVKPVLVHRLIVRPESRLRRVTGAQIVDEIVSEASVPVMPGGADLP
jgi:MoxR-like ATPase